MIRNVIGKLTLDIYHGVNSRFARKLPVSLHGKTKRLLDQINTVPRIEILRAPPSNRLEKLHGDRVGYWSLRINDQWRIIFQWKDQNALNVEIIDYHR